MDKDGWQYDFDFAWIKFPAEAGKGKKHMKIVRRRRWIRTRSRLEGTSSSCKGSEPGFTLPNVTDIMDRCCNFQSNFFSIAFGAPLI